MGGNRVRILFTLCGRIFCDGSTAPTKAMGKADSRGNECTYKLQVNDSYRPVLRLLTWSWFAVVGDVS